VVTDRHTDTHTQTNAGEKIFPRFRADDNNKHCTRVFFVGGDRTTSMQAGDHHHQQQQPCRCHDNRAVFRRRPDARCDYRTRYDRPTCKQRARRPHRLSRRSLLQLSCSRYLHQVRLATAATAAECRCLARAVKRQRIILPDHYDLQLYIWQ